MIARPVSFLFMVLSLAMSGLAAWQFVLHASQGDAVTTFAAAVLGPLGLLGAVVWGVSLVFGGHRNGHGQA